MNNLKVTRKIVLGIGMMLVCLSLVSAVTWRSNGAETMSLDDSGNLSLVGNFSTSNYGFFGWLGSLTSRITKLWVDEINSTGNIVTSENVTASYLFGDGSQLTGITGGLWTNSSGNATFTSGNVGIGTSSPEKLLHINTSGGNELQYALKLQNPDNTNIGTATGILFKISSSDATNSKGGIAFERRVSSGRGHIRFLQNGIADATEATLNDTVVTITRDGNLGIGNYTQSITSPLTISRDGSGGGLIKLEDTQTNGQSLYINNGWSGAGGVGMAGFYFGDKQIMTMNQSSGGVGIGTSSPDMKLEIEGTTSNSPATSGTSQNGSLRLSNSGNNLTLDFGQTSSSPWGTWIQSTDKTNLTTGYNLILNPNGGSLIIDGSNVITDKVQGSVNNINLGPSTLQKITALGFRNVAIGFQAMEENTDGDENTAVGYWALRKNTVGIDNAAFGRGALYSSVSGSNSVAVGKSTGYFFTGTQGTFLGSLAGSDANNGTGNILIGYNVQPTTSVVSNELNIGNVIYGNLSSGNVGIGTTSPGSYKLYISGGTAYCDQATCWNDASDISLKKDIEESTYGLSEVLKLKPRKYKYKKNDEESFGLIAQEVEKIIPEIVSGEEGSKGIAYGSLTPVLIKAIQEQQQEIDSLKLIICEELGRMCE